MPTRKIRPAVHTHNNVVASTPATPSTGCCHGTPGGAACLAIISIGVANGKNDIPVTTALFGSYRDAITTALGGLDISKATAFNYQVFSPNTLVGVIIGASVVFMFSGLAINAVTRAAGAIVFEVRRQFREHPGIMDGTEKPEYGETVSIVTLAAQKEMIAPALIPIVIPVIVGLLSVDALGGLLIGVIVVGLFAAIPMSIC